MLDTANTDKSGTTNNSTPNPDGKATEQTGLTKDAVQKYLQEHPDDWGNITVKKGEETITFAEGVNRGLRQADYTKKTQELAQKAKALAENRPAVTKDDIRQVLFEDSKNPPKPTSPFDSPELSAKWGEEAIVNDPVGFARELAAEHARLKMEFDSRLNKEVEKIGKDIKEQRISDAYQRDVANVRSVIPDFTEDKKPALWNLAHQVYFGPGSDKPSAMLGGKIPNTMTFTDVAVEVRKHLGEAGKAEHEAVLEAEKKRRTAAVTLGPNSAAEVSYPPEIEAIKDPRARMQARGAYMVKLREGSVSG